MKHALDVGLVILSLLSLYILVYIVFRVLRCRRSTAKWISIGISLAYFSCASVFIAIMAYGPDSLALSNKYVLEEEVNLMFAGMVIAINLLVMPFFYWIDKRKAVTESESRIPESALHFFAFIGGGAGAMVSQYVFRHKTTKQPFRRVFWFSFMSSLMVYSALLYVFIEQHIISLLSVL